MRMFFVSQKLCSPSWCYFIPTFPLSGSSNLNPQLKSQARETIGSAPEDKTKMRGLQALLVWNDLSGKGLEGAESVETPYETNLYDPGTIALQSLIISRYPSQQQHIFTWNRACVTVKWVQPLLQVEAGWFKEALPQIGSNHLQISRCLVRLNEQGHGRGFPCVK